jgi:hypothetical protein
MNQIGPEQIHEIQKLVIEPSEIRDLANAMAERDQTGNDYDPAIMTQILAPRYGEDSLRAFSVAARFDSLLPLLDNALLCEWAIGVADPQCAVAAVYRAAARCPLRSAGRRLFFDSDEFFQIVRREAGLAAAA